MATAAEALCVIASSLLLGKGGKKGKKMIVNPSRCVTMREMWAVCPSHSTRGKNVSCGQQSSSPLKQAPGSIVGSSDQNT